MARISTGGDRRVGLVCAAAAVLAGITLSACSPTTPRTVSAVESPALSAAPTATPKPTASIDGSALGPIPTVRADPLTPTRPSPSATSAGPTAAPTAPATTPAPASTTPAPGSVTGSCERTLTAYPVLEPGARGPAVQALQCFLDDADYGPVAVDGSYGPQTRAAVARLEAGYEAAPPEPGRIDAGTWVLLIARSLGDRTLRVGSTGADVVTLQRALRAAGGTLRVDGNFGTQTKKVVQRFQQANRVGDDGVVDEETLFLLKMGATIG